MLPLLHALAVLPAGWLNRHQQRVLEYLGEESRVLSAQLCTDHTGRRLLARGVEISTEIFRMSW